MGNKLDQPCDVAFHLESFQARVSEMVRGGAQWTCLVKETQLSTPGDQGDENAPEIGEKRTASRWSSVELQKVLQKYLAEH